MSIITQKLGSTQTTPSASLQDTAIASLIPKQLPDPIINRISSFTSYDELTHTTRLVSKRCPKLPIHVLNLNNSLITDEELIEIIDKEKNSLTHINLSNCKNITDQSLKHLYKLKNLTALDLSHCDNITDAGVKDLSKLQNLKTLNLQNCIKITATGVKDLSTLQNLTALNLNNCYRIEDTGAKSLSTLLNLTALDLNYCNITDAGIKDLSKLQNLKILNLTGSDIRDAGVKDLYKLQNLTALNLSHCWGITDADAKNLSKLLNLTALDLSHCEQITDASAKDLSKLLNLTALNLSGCDKITDVGAKDLSKLLNLTALNLSGCDKITDVGAKDLSKLLNLTALNLSGCDEITDVGAKDLSKLLNLTALNLSSCDKITDAGAKDLSTLQNLTALNLNFCVKITDAGVEDLVNHLQHLTKLELSGAINISATNAKQLNSIRQLFVEKTALSEFISEKSRKFGIRKCELLIKNNPGGMRCTRLPTGYQITIDPLYLLEERNMDSFLSQNPDDQENVSAFLIQKKPKLLEKAAKDLVDWFNSNKPYHVPFTLRNELAKEALIMHATGKLSANKRFWLTHEMGHAHDWDGRKSLGDFDPLELDFIKPHQFAEVRADLTAAREENAHDVGIAFFEWMNILFKDFLFDEYDPHPTGENRVKVLKIDHDKILKKMTISTS